MTALRRLPTALPRYALAALAGILMLAAGPALAASMPSTALGTTPSDIYAPSISLSSEQSGYLLAIALAIALIGFALAEPNAAGTLYAWLRRRANPLTPSANESHVRA